MPNTQRVVRPDGRAGQQEDSAQSDSTVRYDSHFQVFLKRLRETPDAAESLRRIFTGETAVQVSSGLHSGSAEELAELFALLQVDESELLKFLSEQLKSGTQFGGVLFALLRNACAKADSEMVQESILRFLKTYLDYFAKDRLQENIMRDLGRMASAMPASWADRLREMSEHLSNLMQHGSRQDSLLFLQRDILPFMGQYVSRSHDMGLPRDLLNMLNLEIARYENADKNNLLEAFHQIKGFSSLRQQLSGIDDEVLLKLLERSRPDAGGQVMRFSERLADRAAQALRGSGSQESQQTFQELVRAILINESVYMPLNHYLVPLQMDGRMLFSELWVDPDADEDSTDRQGQGQNSMRFLFKMDVEGIGLIDMVLSSRGDKVELKLSCPEGIVPFSKRIEQDLSKILRENELVPTQISVRTMQRPTALTEVFPKIFERKDSLNVKV